MFRQKVHLEDLDPDKINSIKNLFFDCLPQKSIKSFNRTECQSFKRSEQYRLFDEALKKYNEEIDIVRMMRDLRYYKVAVEKLMSQQPKKVQDEIED